MEKIIYPDFNGNNIINISATLADFLHNPNDRPIIPTLKEELQKGYKNVAFIVFDALGIHPLHINSPKGLFERHCVRTLTTVFPSTTACASASFLSGLYPSEHERFGWCMDLIEMGGRVDILTGQRSEDHTQTVDMNALRALFPLTPFYDETKTEYNITSLLPSLIFDGKPYRKPCEDIPSLFRNVREAFLREGKQFVYAHCPQPDGVFHHFGVTSEKAKETVAQIERETELLLQDFSDTLLIISADHGQIDITGYTSFYTDETLLSYLSAPISVEVRALSFKVKEGKEEEFCSYFQRVYGRDYLLMKTEDLIQKGVFGPRTDHLGRLGTYLGVGTETARLGLMHRNTDCFLGQHTGLTPEEMYVPLILLHSEN